MTPQLVLTWLYNPTFGQNQISTGGGQKDGISGRARTSMSRYNNWCLLNVDAHHSRPPTRKKITEGLFSYFSIVMITLFQLDSKIGQKRGFCANREGLRIYVKRDISKAVLLITETQFQKHFFVTNYPSKVGKYHIRGLFCPLKSVFWSLLRLATQNLLFSQFWNLVEWMFTFTIIKF